MRCRGRTLPVILGTAVVVAALTGCEVPTLEPKAADELQQQVSEISEAAAAGEYEESLTGLDGLSARLETALRLGEVSRSRADRINGAIEAVRLSLETETSPAGREN